MLFYARKIFYSSAQPNSLRYKMSPSSGTVSSNIDVLSHPITPCIPLARILTEFSLYCSVERSYSGSPSLDVDNPHLIFSVFSKIYIKESVSLPLTVASSPSECANSWHAVGETQIGMLNSCPRTVTEMS